jgi:hypothetical protein
VTKLTPGHLCGESTILCDCDVDPVTTVVVDADGTKNLAISIRAARRRAIKFVNAVGRGSVLLCHGNMNA